MIDESNSIDYSKMNNTKKRLCELISKDKLKEYIKFTDRNGNFVPRYLKLLKTDNEVLEEIKLYWDENIGWLDDKIFITMYNDFFQLQCIVYYFEYSLNDLTCNNSKCSNLVWVKQNIPERYCSNSCKRIDSEKIF